jgi:glycosyltransferase involved in cell wall biosynthesis
MRLLVVTARYPTADRPSAGIFVQQRLAGVDATIVAPVRYDRAGWQRYLALTWRALTARGRHDGVEGQFVMPSGVVALLAARLRRLPFIAVAHGSDVRVIAHHTPFHRWLARRVLRGAAVVVANSDETAADIMALSGRTAVIVPPGVDLARFRPAQRPAERRVLYLGGAARVKGVDIAQRLADTLAGPGIREVPPAEVPALLAAHDALLVPSRAEGYGLVAAEAIAAGRWVVASRVGGLMSVVTDGVNGTLVDGAEADAFRAALASMPDYDPVAVAATAERFDIRRQRAAMDDLWRRVLEGVS